MERDPTPGRAQGAADPKSGSEHALMLDLDTFAWEALTEQSDLLGVPVEDLVAFSVLYYLADLDSQRIARRIPDPRTFSDRGG